MITLEIEAILDLIGKGLDVALEALKLAQTPQGQGIMDDARKNGAEIKAACKLAGDSLKGWVDKLGNVKLQ